MLLSINIDHVATLRNARGGNIPDPVEAALTSERAGANGIVCHLREDKRHIRDADVERLRASVTTKLDLEMAATRDIIKIARRVRPDLVTLVPERRAELTTEGGLDVIRLKTHLRRSVDQLHEKGIPVSLFIDPKKKQIEEARETGAEMIELHTGEYADAASSAKRADHLDKLRSMAAYAKSIGFTVNAGHGLDYTNIGPVAAISDIHEVSIGHAIIVRALEIGLEEAVRQMARLVGNSPR